MPGELMTDGRDERLFDHFSAVAQRSGVYTAADYGDMVEHFVRRRVHPGDRKSTRLNSSHV